MIFFWDLCTREGTCAAWVSKFEGRAINKLNWKAVLKFELLSQIFEESTYLVNSVRVGLNHIKHQEDDDWESGGFIVVLMGKCIKCELAGVRNVFLTPALRL